MIPRTSHEPMRVLVHGSDERLEGALRDRGLELVSEGVAGAMVALAPAPLLRPLAQLTPDEWTTRFHLCTEEPFWAIQAWLQGVLARGAPGRLVALTTTLGAQPFPGGGADGAAAVALQTLVRIAAVEYGSRGIRANAIAAGWREATLPAALDSELALADTPTGRLTSESDLAATVLWLLSDDAEQVNGEILRVDGGYTVTGGARPDPRRN
jgi:NAD(P)-dependent dehydrogenase (short-subunit alcohol dehydrogenase family)